jgi:hypothetical protein
MAAINSSKNLEILYPFRNRPKGTLPAQALAKSLGAIALLDKSREPQRDSCSLTNSSRKTGYKIFDRYHECGVQVLNNERPHEALDMKYPVEVYRPSNRFYSGLPNIIPPTTKPS